MIITIQVTQEDIDQGERHSCLHCPIALALGRVIDWDEFRVHPYSIRFKFSDVILLFPERVIRFIRDYDGGASPPPFCFRMDIPEQYLAVNA